MKIIHISDIHIRPLARHEEYKLIFSQLYEKIDEIKEEKSIIVTGDIADEKLRMTPEFIDLTVNFFDNLSKRASVHIMLGNHDGNLANTERQDVISPIINAMNKDNIFLYKDSGVYKLNKDINLCVFSCFDEKGWDLVKPEENMINIALFHGSVFGATTDVGYTFTSNIDIDFFNSFDYTLLGDIHQMQFLTANRKIAYAGSLIQQNFGEDIDKHGFLLWDIIDKEKFNVQFVKLKNSTPFVSIPWSSIENVKKEASKYPDGSRFRILSEYPLLEKEKSIIDFEIKENKKSSVVYKFEKKNESYVKNENNLKENLRNKNVLLNLSKDFIGKEKLNKEQWESLESILETYLGKLNKETCERNVTCQIKKLEFDNIFGYGEGNVINFDNINGIVGILGENSIGKSTIIATIIYSLFGTTDRDLGQGKTHFLINTSKNECITKIWINVSGIDYLIERKTIRKSKGDKYSAQNFVYFNQILDDGTFKNLGGIDPSDTNKEISKRIGSVEDFLLTNVAAQRNMGKFIDEKSTRRKEIVSRFRDILIIDEIYDFIKNDLTLLKNELKSLNIKDWDKEIESLADEKIQKVDELEELNELFVKTNEKHLIVTSDLNSLISQERVKPSDIKEKENKYNLLIKEKESLFKKSELSNKRKSEINERISSILTEKNSIPVSEYKEILIKNDNLSKKLSKIQTDLILNNSEFAIKKKVISKLDVVPCGDLYPTCMYIKDAHEEKKNISVLENKISLLEKGVKEIKDELIDVESIQSKIDKFDKLTNEELKLSKELSLLDFSYDSKLENVDKDILLLKKEIDSMKLMIHDEIEMTICNLTSLKDELNKELKQIDNKKMSISQRIGQLNSEYKSLILNKKKFDEKNNLYQIYDVLLMCFSKKGIQSQIMKNELPIINKEINNILIGNVDFKIELEIDEESDKLEIYLEDEKGGRRPIECCGGMQNVICSMAIRFGLTEASSLPKTNMMIFDEAFNALDANYVDAVSKIFYSLKKWYKSIIIISHDEKVKNICDNFIQMKNNGKFSYILNN